MPKEPRNVTYIDPIFDSPPEVKDFQVKTTRNTSLETAPATDMAPNIVIENPISNVGTVNQFTVVEQIVKTNADGSHTVDVVIDVPDIVGVTNYNIRIIPA